MISGGAAFTFALLALLAGVGIGSLIPRRDRDDDAPAGPDWGEIGDAAMTAYRGAHGDATDARERPSWMPRMILTSDAMPPGKMALVDDDGFRNLTGVDAETVLRALERA